MDTEKQIAGVLCRAKGHAHCNSCQCSTEAAKAVIQLLLKAGWLPPERPAPKQEREAKK